MTKKYLETVIKWLIYATFFVPLIVVPQSFIFPFIVPKILAFRSLTTVIVMLYGLLLIINWDRYRPRYNPLFLAVLLFLLSFGISTFVGVDPYRSFWDNHERMLGFFTIIHYGIFFLVCSQIFRTWAEWKIALKFFLVAGSLVMFVGIYQVINPKFMLNQGSARVIATLGNAIYVGGYGLFLMFVSVLLFLEERNIYWRVVEGILALVAFLGLLFSGTRGSLLGLVVGVGAGVIGYILVLRNYPKTRKTLIGILIGGILLVGVAYVSRGSDFVKNIPTVGRVLNTDIGELTSGSRIIAWKAAVESWRELPVFGWGPNNFFYAYNAHYNPRALEFGYGETWFDNAHNIIVNTLAVQGIVGLLTYLVIFVVAVYVLVVAYRKNTVSSHLAVLGSAFMIAHLVGNITVFENPTSYLYFMFWLALIYGMTQVRVEKVAADKKIIPDKNLGFGLLTTATIFAALLIFIFDLQPALANMKALLALQEASADPIAALPVINEALNFNSPHIDDIRDDVTRTMIQTVSSLPEGKITADQREQLFKLAEDELKKNIELHPRDIRVYLTIAQLYQTEAIENNDPVPMIAAENYLKTALYYSPRRQQVIYNLAVVEMQLNKPDEAIKLYQQAIKDDPKIAESYIREAYAHQLIGQKDKAAQALALATKNGVVYTDNEQSVVNGILASLAPATSTKKK